jgi:probable phosphoglycerate mutase
VTAPEDLPQAARSYRQNRFRVPPDAAELLLIGMANRSPPPWTPRSRWWTGAPIRRSRPKGHHQAQRVAARLAAAGIDAIYVTTLRRTAETAAPLASRLAWCPPWKPGLREVGLGDWEGGLFRKMVAENHPTAMQMWAQESFDVIPGAEPAAEFADRVRAAIGRVAAGPHRPAGGGLHPWGRDRAGARAGQRVRPFAFVTSDNGSISRLVVAGPRWFVRGFNDTAHLEQPWD